MKTILFTGSGLSDEHRAKLEQRGYKVVVERANLSEDELIAALQGVSAHILRGSEKFTRRVLENAPSLEIVSFFGTGYASYIDVEAATENGIAVTNAPGANAQSVAEFAITLMLDAVKQTPGMCAATKQGQWKKSITWNLEGRVLGIVGMGAAGSKVAHIAHHGFGMKILYCGRNRKEEVERSTGAGFVSLDELLAASDVVSLHAAQTDETTGMIGAKQLELMKSHAVLVNNARAALVEPAALYQALVEGQIACAAFDVYYDEPAPSPQEDPHKLLTLPDDKFLLAPHASYFTTDAAARTTDMIIESITAAFEGRAIPNLVNLEYAAVRARK